MELISVYLYNRTPIHTDNISNKTFHMLKANDWYSDRRTNQKFTMLNKRFKVNNIWYRTMIRFEYEGLTETVYPFDRQQEVYALSLPCPFVITECEPIDRDIDLVTDKNWMVAKWKDLKTYHGPKLKNVSGFFEQGIPVELIDLVYEELKECTVYND